MLFALALLIPGLWWGMPSEFSPAIDAPGPYSPLAFVGDYSNPALSAIYPAAHQIVLLAVYSIVFVILAITGNFDVSAFSVAWPHGFRDPVMAFTALIMAGRIVSLAMAIGILSGFWRIRFRGWTRAGAACATLLLLGSGAFAYYGRTTNVDVPYLFWWVMSFVALWRYAVTEGGRSRDLMAAAVFAALAVGSKTQAAGLVLGSVLVVLLVGRPGSAFLARVRHAFLFGVAAVGSYVVVAILPQPARWLHHVSNYTLSNDAVGASAEQMETALSAWTSLVYVLSAAGIALAALGVVHLVRARRVRVLATIFLPAAAYYTIIVAATGFAPARFMLPMGFLLAIPAGVGITWTAELARRRAPRAWVRRAWIGVVVTALAAHLFTGYLPVTYSQAASMKTELAEHIEEAVPEGSTVMYVGDRSHLPNADVYTRWQLMASPEDWTRSRSFRHVSCPYHSGVYYVLSTSDEELPCGGAAVRIASWEYPEWVRRTVRVRSLHEYYLYWVPGGTAPAPTLTGS